jgi:hypothetical protein
MAWSSTWPTWYRSGQRGIGAIVKDRQRHDGPVPVTPVSSGRGISRGEPAQRPGPRPGTVDDGASMAGGVCRRPTYSATATPAACTPMVARRALTDLWLAAPGAVMSPRYDAPRLSSTNSASRTPRPGTSCMPSSGHRRPTASPPWPPSASTSGPATATSDSPPASNPSWAASKQRGAETAGNPGDDQNQAAARRSRASARARRRIRTAFKTCSCGFLPSRA